MEASTFIVKENGVETAKICRWCQSTSDALKPLLNDKSGQYKLQKLSECTGVQVKLLPGVPLYLCTMCNSRLEKAYLMQCNKNIASVNGFTENQNIAKNGADNSKDHLGHFTKQTVGSKRLIKTEVTAPDTASDLHLNQRSCTAAQVNGTHECCGNQPFEAGENSITIKLEYVDVDELYATNAILKHEQDGLQINPLELVCQDREDHSMSNNMCADGTELLIKTEVSTSDAALDLHLNQKSCTAQEANWTYECYDNQPGEFFEAEENTVAIKSEDEEVDEQQQPQTTNDVLDHEQDNQKINPLESIYHDHPWLTVADNTCADDAAAESIQNDLSPGTKNAHSESHSKNHKHHCLHCSTTYPSLRMLKDHIRTHTSERPYVCMICYKTFRSLQALTQHISVHKEEGYQPYRCKVCDKAFDSSGSLAVHSEIHNNMYECCDNQADDLFEAEENPIAIKSEYEEVDEQHQLQATNDAQNHVQQCPHCSSRFTKSYNLKVHIRTHTGERPYVCKVCDKAFHSSFHLTNHSKIHIKDQPHQCPHCSFTFLWLSSLNTHMRTHTGESPYVCKVCDKNLYSSVDLTNHSQIHNEDQHHQCPHCPSSFPWIDSLKIHIRTHTGERPYQCKVCDKAFFSSSTLTTHSKSHNKNQHQCPHCSSRFTWLSSLKIHIRTHTGETPFQCKVCAKAFRSSKNLAQHSKIHNKS